MFGADASMSVVINAQGRPSFERRTVGKVAFYLYLLNRILSEVSARERRVFAHNCHLGACSWSDFHAGMLCVYIYPVKGYMVKRRLLEAASIVLDPSF